MGHLCVILYGEDSPAPMHTHISMVRWCVTNVLSTQVSFSLMSFISCALQVLGTDELNAYLNKYHLELDPQLDALVGRYV